MMLALVTEKENTDRTRVRSEAGGNHQGKGKSEEMFHVMSWMGR
jgi:hypothetical protein